MQNIKPKVIIAIAALISAVTIAYFAFAREAVAPGPETNLNQTTEESNQSENLSENCDGALTPAQTEGPYYKTGSPQKNNIAENIEGQKLTVTGYVFDKDCNPISGAWLDFWQADTNGDYDNQTYKLRGHQFTSDKGQYRLETIIPAAYESRPPHIHVKVRGGNGPILTSQLYFPNQEFNKTDSIFNEDLIMKTEEGQNETLAHFNFVLP